MRTKPTSETEVFIYISTYPTVFDLDQFHLTLVLNHIMFMKLYKDNTHPDRHMRHKVC